MTFSKIAGGLLLLAALVPTTQATPVALRALQRNRRAGFCDAMQKSLTCSQQQASACTGDCAVNEEGECNLNPAVMLQSFNMQAMLGPLLACGLGGMGGEEACNNAQPGGMCKWTTDDEGQPTCSVHADKLVAAMGGGDPVMNDVITASVTCSQHGSQNRCSADTNCEYDGDSCGPNMMAFMSKCATSAVASSGGASSGGGSSVGFCDTMQTALTCSQQQASACTGDCAVNEEGQCNISPAVAMQSVNLMAALAPALACGFGGMGGEEACNNAYPAVSGMCDWTTDDDGEPTCSVHADKLKAAMGGGDPVMGDMLVASVTCGKHKESACASDAHCQYEGGKCGVNQMAFMSKCATSGGSDGGGSGVGDKCKGLTKMGSMYLPCAGKDKAACGAVGTCSYQEEDMECTPSMASAMQAMMSDKDVMAAQQYIMAAGSGCDTKGEAACQADAKCEAGLEQRKSMNNNCQNGVCTVIPQTTFAKTCEVHVPTMLGGAGCDGSVLAMFYRIKAGEQKVEARKAKAAKDKATADKPKLVEAATAKKAAYEEAKKAADACIDSTFGVDTTNNITAGACDQEKQAAATAKSESQAADAAVASNDATITSAASAATQFEADVVATEADAAEVATTAGESTTAAGESTTAASNDESPASRLVSSAAAVFAAAAAAAMAL